jgi:hypothetical protein
MMFFLKIKIEDKNNSLDSNGLVRINNEIFY